MVSLKQPEKELVFSKAEIEDRVQALAREISRTYKGRDVVLIGVLNGVFMFFSDLVKALDLPVRIDFVRLASYGDGAESSGRIKMTKGVEIDLTGRDVLIIEDIADSGLTLDYLKNYLAGLGASSVKTCVLINKMERRDVSVSLEFAGFKVDQGFLVGYGLDYDEQYRYLPEIYHLIMT